ncbi:MAG: hypothetical protein RL685_382 [Pseudomonadota bacterium]|jgi:hypothetical protein
MVERVYGRTDAQSLGRTLQRRLGLDEAPYPTRPCRLADTQSLKTAVAHL